jgi:hypothetical protein
MTDAKVSRQKEQRRTPTGAEVDGRLHGLGLVVAGIRFEPRPGEVLLLDRRDCDCAVGRARAGRSRGRACGEAEACGQNRPAVDCHEKRSGRTITPRARIMAQPG